MPALTRELGKWGLDEKLTRVGVEGGRDAQAPNCPLRKYCVVSVLSVCCQCVGRLLSDLAIGWQYETSVLPVYYQRSSNEHSWYYQLLSVCKYND